MTQEIAYFCPICCSPAVEVSSLVGGEALCKRCSWKGPNSDLFVHEFNHDLGSVDSAVDRLVQEVLNVFAKLAAVQMGRILVKWGFLDPDHKDAAKQLRWFMTEAGKALTVSFVETRHKIATGHYEREAEINLPKGVDVLDRN